MVSSFLPGCPTDQVLSFETLLGCAAGRLYEQLANARSIEESIRILEGHLEAPAARTPTQRAIEWLVQRGGRVSITELAAVAGLSDRQFRRQCLDHSGLTPKRLCRVIRFRHALSRMRTQPNWAQSADEWGYYDQAHMINEFRELGGFTPHDRFFQYSRQANL